MSAVLAYVLSGAGNGAAGEIARLAEPVERVPVLSRVFAAVRLEAGEELGREVLRPPQ